MMNHATEEGFVKEKCSEIYSYFKDAKELLNYLENYKAPDWSPEYFKKDKENSVS